MSEIVGKEPERISAEELTATEDVLRRLQKVPATRRRSDGFVLLTAREIVTRAKWIAEVGHVPGERP